MTEPKPFDAEAESRRLLRALNRYGPVTAKSSTSFRMASLSLAASLQEIQEALKGAYTAGVNRSELCYTATFLEGVEGRAEYE